MSRACRATLAVITLSVTLTLLLSRPAAEAPNDGELIPGVDYVPGEVFVVFRPLYMPQPAGIALERARFGIPAVDQFLAQHGAKQMRRFLTTYDQCKSEGGRRLERTYLIRFRGPVDTELLVSQLSRMPHFEHVAFNQILKKVFHGTKRFVPDAGTTEFDEQWNLDYYKDKIDIDAPEAWAIERGSGEVVIVINDSGTMMDTCGTGGGQSCATKDSWTIHSDFNHYWISEEDSASNGVLNRYDITQTDNNGDGVNDNIIGYNFAPGYEADTTASGDPSYQLAFWHSMPTPLLLSTASPEEASSWNCVGYWTHGTRVGGIAAAQVEGNDIVGVANECKVYWVRAGLSANANASIEDEADAIIHSAIYADVINMSWGFEEEPDVVLRDALSFAANDSDCVLVASVGNNASSTFIGYPSRYDFVMAVGAVDTAGDSLSLSSYSNYIAGQKGVDVVAPVDNGIWCDFFTNCTGGGDCPCNISEDTGLSGAGTSFASPQVSGIAALIRSRFPGLDQEQVRERIKRGAEYYWAASDSSKYGAGKVNAYRALTEWGHVTSDTAWGATAGMPDTLYVAGDLTIDSGVTLTLNKGTVVRVAGGDVEGSGTDTGKTEIVVKGDLKVGSAGSGPIVFESFVDGTQGDDDWIGIRFENATSSDSLAGVTVRNAKIGIQVDSGVMTLSDCTIKDCQTGIKVLDAAVTVDTCTVRGASSYGLSVVSGDSTVTVERSIFKDNDVGIYSADTTTTTIDGCTIDSCGVGIEAYRNNNVTITECTITNSTTDGVYAHTSSSIKIEGCTITDNATGVLAVDCHPKIWKSSAVKDNTTGIKCDDYADAVVESTTVTGNGVGIAAVNNSDPDLGHESGGSSSGYNIIHTSSSHHVVNLTVGVNISAENVFWDGSETRWTTCQCEPKSSKISGSVDFCPALCSGPTLSSPYVGGPPGDDPELPTVYSLSQNYPNPFNPTTMLRYEVPAPGGLVRVNVYNVRGQLVRTLLNERVAAGVHTLAWDGLNERGESVATGVYFVNMTAAGFTVTRKLVLVK